jgi:hypothetical protein
MSEVIGYRPFESSSSTLPLYNKTQNTAKSAEKGRESWQLLSIMASIASTHFRFPLQFLIHALVGASAFGSIRTLVSL